ncbi:hypothetical protein C8Q78DRAFT_215423 [Trametes maxima]|nr:hypothetical protein C8Q78DRAFT_215423 [Trametes maxima]
MTESVPIEAIAAVEFNKFVDRIFGSVAFALLYYDFFLTLSREIELYWKNTISWPYFLFFLNRYMSVITHIPVIIEFFGDLPAPVCRQIQQYHRVATVVIQAVVVALLTLRTYALYGCNHRILALLLAIIGAAGAVCIWAITVGRGPSATAPTPYTGVQVASRPGCDLTLSQQQGYDTALAWGSVLVFEATVFILTLLQALKVGRAWRGGYIRVMLRDGRYHRNFDELKMAEFYVGFTGTIYFGCVGDSLFQPPRALPVPLAH